MEKILTSEEKKLMVEERQKSYLSKEELITLLTNLDFKYVESLRCELITSMIFDGEKGVLRNLTKHLEFY